MGRLLLSNSDRNVYYWKRLKSGAVVRYGCCLYLHIYACCTQTMLNTTFHCSIQCFLGVVPSHRADKEPIFFLFFYTLFGKLWSLSLSLPVSFFNSEQNINLASIVLISLAQYRRIIHFHVLSCPIYYEPEQH